MQTAISYVRKSYYEGKLSDEEILSYQHNAIRDYCSNHNIKLTKEFNDVNYTGTNNDRPSLQEILDYVKTNQNIDCVVFYSVDRLGRSNSGNIDVVQELTKYVSSIIFVMDGITLGSSNPTMVKMTFILFTSKVAH